MKVLPKIRNIAIKNITDSNVQLTINESMSIVYSINNKLDTDILTDLVNCKAFASMFLYLNENSTLELSKDSTINESNISDFYNDCNLLLKENIKIVEEQGPLLTNINGYPIYEVENGILRGEGAKKIKESFKMSDEEDLAWDLVNFTRDFDTYGFNDNYDSEEDAMNQYVKDLKSISGINGIIAWLNSIKEEADESTYSNETLESLLARLENLKGQLNESEEDLGNKVRDIINNNWNNGYAKSNAISAIYNLIHDGKDEPVFPEDEKDMKKAEELYDEYSKQILSEEGTQCSDIAPKIDYDSKIVKASVNGIKESVILRGFLKNEQGQYQRNNYILCKENNQLIAIHKSKLQEASLDGNDILKNIITIQNTIQQKTGCKVNVEKNGNKLIFTISGDGKQLSAVMPYGDTLKQVLETWGNTVEFDVGNNTFTYTAY